jgi:hypothetical protein
MKVGSCNIPRHHVADIASRPNLVDKQTLNILEHFYRESRGVCLDFTDNDDALIDFLTYGPVLKALLGVALKSVSH